jgi:adenylate cyclase
VLGRVGGAGRSGLTALGDSVNIANRLEDLNKEFGSSLVVSEATLAGSGLTFGAMELKEVPLRGREEGLKVAVVYDVTSLNEQPQAAEA